MRRAFTIFFLLCGIGLSAQTISEGEYYFDTDPGLGSGTPLSFTAGQQVDQEFNLDISSLPEGFHTLYIRFKDSKGHWSLFEKRVFYILPAGSTGGGNPSNRIISRGEYFFDTDPGFGSGTSLSITTGEVVDVEFQLDVSALATGFHKLYIRFGDEEGHWSLTEERLFYILEAKATTDRTLVAMEYFIGDDPGQGNGTPIDIGAATKTFDGEILIDLAPLNLSDADYHLSIRVKDSEGVWSIVTTQGFTICATAAMYYQDLDQDGFGNQDSVQYACFQPAGYVSNSNDCDDSFAEVNTDPVDWYADADGDGFGDPNTIINDCAQPEGYVLIAGDCDDTDADLNPDKIWYEDLDGDGYGKSTKVKAGCNQPTGYVANNLDCNDDDGSINPETVWYYDNDGDGLGDSSVSEMTCSPGFGYVLNGEDCNDSEALIGAAITWYRDLDSDGFGNISIQITDCIQPVGYVEEGGDCDDGDALVGSARDWYMDNDGDGFGVDTDILNACSQPDGYAIDAGDCDDNDPNVVGKTWYPDNDGDGFGVDGTTLVQCDQPSGYADNPNDCDDNNFSIKDSRLWYFDNDGDGVGDQALDSLSCSGPEGYVLATNGFDCDDNDINILAAPLWYFDFDNDGYGGDSTVFACVQPVGFVDLGGDCKDSLETANPATVWYYDSDGDNWGTETFTVTACEQPANYVADFGDCDDNDEFVYPGAAAQPDGKDNDCDGEIDKAAQLITFDPIPNQKDGDPSFALDAISDAGLTVSYSVEGPASLNGNQLMLTGAGAVTVSAFQPGNDFYLAADTVTQTFCINPTPEVTVDIDFALLSSNYETGNQWLLSGAELPGATAQTYEALQSGNYSVQVTIDGCSASSVEKAVQLGLGNVIPLDTELSFSDRFDSKSTSSEIIITPLEGVPPYTVRFEYRNLQTIDFSTISQSVKRDSSFTFTVDNPILGDIGLAFRATVTDKAGSEEVISTRYIHRSFTDEDSPSIPNLSFGGELSNYRIISIPYDLDNKGVTEVFEAMGEYNTENWRLVHWDPDRKGWIEPGSGISLIRLGEGYFFNARGAQQTIKLGSGTVNKQDQTSITLSPGFNQIGNPYNIPISWQSVRSSNSVTEIAGQLRVFNPSLQDYQDGDIMEPFTGGFVFSSETKTIKIDPAINKEGGRISNQMIVSRNISSDEWFIPLQLGKGNKTITLGGPGMHPDAEEEYDQFDNMTVPRFVGFTDLISYHPNYFYPKFSRDIVPTARSWNWEFTIESNTLEGSMVIEWPLIESSDPETELWLVDQTTGSIINMKEITSYPIRLDGKHKISIQYLKGTGNVGSMTMMGNPFPNPSSNGMRIPVIISSANYRTTASLKIFDLNGRTINDLYQGTLESGVHYFQWDGKTGKGLDVGNGVYICQLDIDGQRFLKRLIIRR